MEIFEAMARNAIDTITFRHDFKKGMVITEPEIWIPEQSDFIKKVLTQRGEGHEKLIFHYRPEVNLKVISNIHDSILGFPLGGSRMRNDYENEEAAIIDVADLSEGMSGKGYWTGTGTSGGKNVLIGDPEKDKTPKFLEAYGDFLEKVGCIITGEDMNFSSDDCSIAARRTKFMTGTKEKNRRSFS